MPDLKNRVEFMHDFMADSRRLHKDQRFFYVDSSISGSATASGRRWENALPTLASAHTLCTAARGDVIKLAPFHAETVTASLAMSKTFVHVQGLRHGADLPVITPNGAIDALNISAASCIVEDIEFAVPGTDAQTADINISGANCAIINTKHHGSTTGNNKVDIITIASGANDLLIDGARIYNTTVEVVGGIVLEAAVARPEIRNCFFFDAVGFTDGCLSDEAAATACYIHHNVFMNAKAATVVVNFVTNSTGTCSFNHVVGRHTTLASNVVTGTGMNFFENRVVEEAALNGAVIPAADTD